jgi:hypothetical protein
MAPVAAHVPPFCPLGAEDADGDAIGVAFGPDVADATRLSVADGLAPLGRLLRRLMLSRVATTASTATTAMTIHVLVRRWRSGREVIPAKPSS